MILNEGEACGRRVDLSSWSSSLLSWWWILVNAVINWTGIVRERNDCYEQPAVITSRESGISERASEERVLARVKDWTRFRSNMSILAQLRTIQDPKTERRRGLTYSALSNTDCGCLESTPTTFCLLFSWLCPHPQCPHVHMSPLSPPRSLFRHGASAQLGNLLRWPPNLG